MLCPTSHILRMLLQIAVVLGIRSGFQSPAATWTGPWLFAGRYGLRASTRGRTHSAILLPLSLLPGTPCARCAPAAMCRHLHPLPFHFLGVRCALSDGTHRYLRGRHCAAASNRARARPAESAQLDAVPFASSPSSAPASFLLGSRPVCARTGPDATSTPVAACPCTRVLASLVTLSVAARPWATVISIIGLPLHACVARIYP